MATKQMIFELIGKDKSASATVRGVSNAVKELGAIGVAAGLALAVGVGGAVGAFADFDAEMSSVKASTHESASNMQLLRAAALEAGADTAYTATQAAGAEEALAKAGISTSNVLGGALSGALDLAAAGQVDVGDAAEYAATAMTQFKLKGSDVPHIADLLAAGAGKAQGSVDDLAQALNQGGLVASQAGFSIEETTGALAAFASAGLVGSDAGTSLKTAILALENPSSKARDAMDEYGIKVYDAQGNMLSMTGIAGELQSKLTGLTDEQKNAALATIFGNDAVRSANVLYDQGADGIQNWIDKVNDQGYAAETAATRLDNLNGDVEKLGGSFETALINSGSGANDVLRTMTQMATGLIDGYNNLPPAAQGTVTAVAAVTAGIALVGGTALIAVPKIAQFKESLKTLDVTGAKVGKTLGRGGLFALALTAAAGVVSSYGSSVSLTAEQVSRLDAVSKTGNLSKLNDEFVDSTGNAQSFGDAMNGLFTDNFWNSYAGGPQQLNGAIKALSLGMIDLGAWADTNKAKFAQLGEQLGQTASTDLKGAAAAFDDYVQMAVKSGRTQDEAVKQALSAFPAYKAAIVELAAAQGVVASDQDVMNIALGKGTLATQIMRDQTARATSGLNDMSASAQDASGDVSELAQQLRDFGSAQFDMNAAQRDFEEAVDSATETLKSQQDAFQEANGTLDGFVASLDIGTQEGRDNAAALDAIAKSANESAAAIYTQTGSVDQSTDALNRGKDALYQQLAAFGITGAAADEYVKKLLATPADVQTQVQLNGVSEAEAAMQELTRQRVANILVNATNPNIGFGLGDGSANGNLFVQGVKAFANGGEGIYRGRPGALYKFAEQETGWEAFISGRPGQEKRNAGIAIDALSRLGYGPSTSGQSVMALGMGDVHVHITNKTGVRLSDLIDVQIEKNGQRRKVSLENGVRS